MEEGQQTEQTFSVPQEYQEKGWAQNLKSIDDLWKATDNAQVLIGKRPAGIPDALAPDADWEKFYSAAGRPESADKYSFADIEGLPEGADLSRQKEMAQKLFHSVGLNQRQADRLWKDYVSGEMEYGKQAMAQHEAKQKELDDAFDKTTKEVFGDKYNDVALKAQDLMKAHAPKQLVESLAGLGDSPQTLAAVIGIVNNMQAEIDKVKAEYGAEGKLTTGAQSAADNIEDVRKNLANLRTSQAARDFMHPDHKKTMQEIDVLSGKVNAYFK
jgi:hypothetical protein